MPLFDKVGRGREQVTPEVMRREIGTIQSDPGTYLSRRGFSIPAGMTDAKEITQHLLRTGQIGGPRLQQVMQMLGVPGTK